MPSPGSSVPASQSRGEANPRRLTLRAVDEQLEFRVAGRDPRVFEQFTHFGDRKGKILPAAHPVRRPLGAGPASDRDPTPSVATGGYAPEVAQPRRPATEDSGRRERGGGRRER